MAITFYLVILLIGSLTLSKKINELVVSYKTNNTKKVKADIFFLTLTMLLIVSLILFVRSFN